MDEKETNIHSKEEELQKRLERLNALEADIKRREKSVKEKEKAKKQVLLRLSPSLWNELAKWADEDFRSINGQIEYLLHEAVKQRKKKS